jgi:hypothetical protein
MFLHERRSVRTTFKLTKSALASLERAKSFGITTKEVLDNLATYTQEKEKSALIVEEEPKTIRKTVVVSQGFLDLVNMHGKAYNRDDYVCWMLSFVDEQLNKLKVLEFWALIKEVRKKVDLLAEKTRKFNPTDDTLNAQVANILEQVEVVEEYLEQEEL